MVRIEHRYRRPQVCRAKDCREDGGIGAKRILSARGRTTRSYGKLVAQRQTEYLTIGLRETFSIFGFDPTNGIPTLKEWLSVLHSVDSDRVDALIQKMFSDGVKGDIQYGVDHHEHGQRTMHSTGDPVFQDGKVVRLIGNTLDITEQEKATQELQRSEAYLAEAQRLSHTGSFGWDVSTGEIFWSDETFRIFELDPKTEITIELIVQRTHPDDRQAVRQVIERASRDRTEFALEHRLLMPDGSIKYLQVVGRPSTDEGRCSEFVGAVTDITDHKRAENELRNSEQKYRDLVDTTPAFVHTNLPNGDLDFVNRGWLEYLGLSNTDLLGSRWTSAIHPEDVEDLVAKWRAALESGEGYVAEARVRRADGEYRWFLHREEPLRNEAGEIRQMVRVGYRNRRAQNCGTKNPRTRNRASTDFRPYATARHGLRT